MEQLEIMKKKTDGTQSNFHLKNRYIRQLQHLDSDNDPDADADADADADTKRDPDPDGDVVIFLSVKTQREWIEKEKEIVTSNGTRTGKNTRENKSKNTAVGCFLEAMPFGHMARKNVGYLYAIAHGAKVIFDLDDYNLLPLTRDEHGEEQVIPPIYDTEVLTNAAMVVTGPKAFNHHAIMGITVEGPSWPRGFPITQIHNSATHGKIAMESGELEDISLEQEVGVLQFVADHHPDIDTVHRLATGTQNTPTPMFFRRHVKHHATTTTTIKEEAESNYYNGISHLSTEGSLLVPSHTYVPYNAQASLHMKRAIFALFLPLSVEGRVSDIWRAYFAQRIFGEIDTSRKDGLKVVVLPPDIYRHRDNEQSVLVDERAEEDLYHKGEALLEFLDDWEFNDDNEEDADMEPDEENHWWSIPVRMEKLWIDLYEHDFIGIKDVQALQLWLSALAEIGYEFPKVTRKKERYIRDVVVMGQFNYGKYAGMEHVMKDVLVWYQKWRQRFHKVVIRGDFSDSLVEELTGKHEIDVQANDVRHKGDKGLYSPVSNLLSVVTKYKGNPKINGVLYTHDDMLLNVTNIFDGVNRKTTMLGTTPEVPSKLHTPFIRVHRNGVIKHLKNDVGLWYWTPMCETGFSNVVKDSRSDFFVERDESMEGGDPFLTMPSSMQADMLYVPTSAAELYESFAAVFASNDVFLECAFPKIIELMLEASPDLDFQSLNLCTNWDYQHVRGTPEMVSKCEEALLPNTHHAAIHPFKINDQQYNRWSKAFDWVTTGTKSFNAADYH